MLSIIVRGRIAWIISLILGATMCVLGVVLKLPTFLFLAGMAFFMVGAGFLILSLGLAHPD